MGHRRRAVLRLAPPARDAGTRTGGRRHPRLELGRDRPSRGHRPLPRHAGSPPCGRCAALELRIPAEGRRRCLALGLGPRHLGPGCGRHGRAHGCRHPRHHRAGRARGGAGRQRGAPHAGYAGDQRRHLRLERDRGPALCLRQPDPDPGLRPDLAGLERLGRAGPPRRLRRLCRRDPGAFPRRDRGPGMRVPGARRKRRLPLDSGPRHRRARGRRPRRPDGRRGARHIRDEGGPRRDRAHRGAAGLGAGDHLGRVAAGRCREPGAAVERPLLRDLHRGGAGRGPERGDLQGPAVLRHDPRRLRSGHVQAASRRRRRLGCGTHQGLVAARLAVGTGAGQRVLDPAERARDTRGRPGLGLH